MTELTFLLEIRFSFAMMLRCLSPLTLTPHYVYLHWLSSPRLHSRYHRR